MTSFKSTRLAAITALILGGVLTSPAVADPNLWGHVSGADSVENLNQAQLNMVQQSQIYRFRDALGRVNAAAVIQLGNNHSAGIAQSGGSNSAVVTQTGNNTTVLVNQIGNHNHSRVMIYSLGQQNGHWGK